MFLLAHVWGRREGVKASKGPCPCMNGTLHDCPARRASTASATLLCLRGALSFVETPHSLLIDNRHLSPIQFTAQTATAFKPQLDPVQLFAFSSIPASCSCSLIQARKNSPTDVIDSYYCDPTPPAKVGLNPATAGGIECESLTKAMPPRSSLTSSFSASDPSNEVVCPLRSHDGSNCRKRCLGVSSVFSQPALPANLSLEARSNIAVNL